MDSSEPFGANALVVRLCSSGDADEQRKREELDPTITLFAVVVSRAPRSNSQVSSQSARRQMTRSGCQQGWSGDE